MQTRALLADHIQNHDLCPGASTVEEWLGKDSIDFRLGNGRTLKLPQGFFRRGLAAHDVHHVLTGYPTTLRGEVEVASWELASGGCHRHVAYWLDRVTLCTLGLFVYPRASWRAFRRGWGSHNLYAMSAAEILDAEVEALRERMRI